MWVVIVTALTVFGCAAAVVPSACVCVCVFVCCMTYECVFVFVRACVCVSYELSLSPWLCCHCHGTDCVGICSSSRCCPLCSDLVCTGCQCWRARRPQAPVARYPAPNPVPVQPVRHLLPSSPVRGREGAVRGGDADHGAGQVPGDDPGARQARRETVARGQLGRCFSTSRTNHHEHLTAFKTIVKPIWFWIRGLMQLRGHAHSPV